MRKKIFIIGFFILFICLPFLSFPQGLAYKYLVDLGKDAFRNGNYDDALHYFNLAQLTSPSAKEPLAYINLIKRLKEGKVKEVILPERKKAAGRALGKPREKIIYRKVPPAKARLRKRKIALRRTLDKLERRMRRKEKKYILERLFPFIKKKAPLLKEKVKLAKREKIIVLTDELRTRQAKLTIEVEMDKSLIIKGENIKRFLVVSGGFIDVERIDRNRIKVIGRSRGSTFLHLWDDRGRWTFNVKVVLPVEVVYLPKEEIVEETAEPFKFAYSADWNSYYRGLRVGTMNRQSLTFYQWAGIFGETPYGKFDSAANFTKFKESTEVTGYTVGLTKGKIGSLRDFNLRGFDSYKRFSSLSLPGEGFRGISWEAKAFHNNLKYDLLWGRERVVYGYLTPGVLTKQDSYIEGAKLTLFPYKNNTFSFNFAKGYGSAREDYLKERVFSVEAKNSFKNIRLSSELAFDEEKFAVLFNSEFARKNFKLKLSFRNIEKDFTTITSRPAERGELGGRVSLDLRRGGFSLSSDLDVYRDRYLFNPQKPHRLNFDLNTSLYLPLSQVSRWQAYFAYSDELGLLSPRKDLRINTTYTRIFKLLNKKNISLFLGPAYQRARYPASPSSDYDRYGLSGGLRFPLIKNLFYYLNYDYSWVKETLSGGKSSPRALTTGLTYHKQISQALSADMNFNYRDEEDTLSSNSFLAGEDSLEGSLDFNFKPSEDITFFMGGRLRNIWAEKPGRDAFNEAVVRWGLRSSWGTPFHWSPKGEIKGIVFKDLNGNKRQDKNEQGISGVKVKVGKKQVVTDQRGAFSVNVRAKMVVVRVNTKSIPKGYVFTSAPSKKVEIIPHKSEEVNFGLNIHSGIYGVVFYDKNFNGRPDAGDVFIYQTKIMLDERDIAVTDADGEYFFRDLPSGKHAIKIDVNSLPLEYLPLIKITNEIEIQEGTTYIYHIPLKKKS